MGQKLKLYNKAPLSAFRWPNSSATEFLGLEEGNSNSGSYAAGGALRSTAREFHTGFTIALGSKGCNSLVEASGILQGLKMVRSLGLSHIQVQSDSMLLVQLLTGKAKTSWGLDCLIKDILLLLNQLLA
ncbi:hypothetical protein M9H77_30625 [Catharanthus roseus]|uniref:Uncharacterized protein n=1 Tax=Catharanthus roseus TaxID=4058 RepID=A0ACC0A227_CATRO|nr:hypothetical protein M9H77_30625 [Catharanthus roseus]